MEARVLLALSLSIGRHRELEPMLRHFLLTLVRNINIAGAVVLQRRLPAKVWLDPIPTPPFEDSQWRIIRTMPRGLEYDARFQRVLQPETLDRLYMGTSAQSNRTRRRTLGEEPTLRVFELPGFGLLLVGDTPQPLPENFWNAFRELAIRLADACWACLRNEELQYKRELEKTLVQCSLKLLAAREGQLWPVLRHSLANATRRLGADESYVVIYGDRRATPYLYWSSERVSKPLTVDTLPREALEWLRTRLDANRVLHIKTSELAADHVLYPLLLCHGVRAHISIALCSGGQCEGFLGINWHRPVGDHQGVPDDNILQILADMIDNARLRSTQHAALHAIQHQLVEESRRARASAQEANVANRAKSRLMAIVSHELRNPLTASQGTLEQLVDAHPEPKSQRALQTLLDANRKMTRIVSDLLDASALEANTLQMQPAATDLHELLDQLDEQVCHLEPENQNQFVLRVAADIPRRVRIDGLRLTQILWNLIGNALKFTVRGTVTVEVEPLHSAPFPPARDNAVTVRFAVTDTGSGISPEYRERLFEPFFQGHTPEAMGPSPGVGLGLAIAHGLIRQMGGELSVDSAPGRGSRFFFDLPLVPVAASPAAEPDPSATGTHPRDPSRHRARILLVDDDDYVREATEDTLRLLGYHVRTALNGEQAVSEATAGDFDLILMDYQMPVMDGFTASRQIRSRRGETGDHKRPLILALTGGLMQDEEERCRAAGMDGILAKPYTRESLRRTLEQWLASGTGPRDTSSTEEDGS